jgi:hypothetical protein
MTTIDEPTAINAIETHYAGCRFRSRLEARWAVFFDTLGLEWHYEPQGYLVGPNRTPYLPDFWMPKLGRWVEVKGAMSAKDFTTLLWAASEIGLPATPVDAELPRLEEIPEPRILLLGDIAEPDDEGASIHWRFDRAAYGRTILTRCVIGGHREMVHDLQVYGSVPAMGLTDPLSRGDDYEKMLVDLTATYLDFRIRADPRTTSAYRAARSARFEHGERG